MRDRNELTPLTPATQAMTALGAACIPDAHGHCATCGDDAQAATVLHVADAGMALVALDGQEIEIDVSLVDDVAEGQVLLVHGGVALERVEAAALMDEADLD